MKMILRAAGQVVSRFLAHDALSWAAAIAYNLLLALFPLLLAFLAIAGTVLHQSELQSAVFARVDQALPVAGDIVRTTVETVIRQRGQISVVALIGLLWTGSGLFATIGPATSRAWIGIRPCHARRGLFWDRARAFAVMFAMGVLLLIAVVLSLAFAVLQAGVARGSGLESLQRGVIQALGNYILPALLSFAAFLGLYRFMPAAVVTVRDIWPGALAATVLLGVARMGYVYYARRFANWSLVYGSIGVVVGLLVWAYILGAILIFCAEIAAEYTLWRDHHRVLPQSP